VSVTLSWLWLSHGKYFYGQFFGGLARPFFDLIGQEDIIVAFRDRFINIVPFLALMAVTPGLSLLRRSAGTLVGLLMLFCSHLLLTWLAGVTPRSSAGGFASHAFTIRLASILFSDSLPFLIWATIAARQVRGLAAWLLPETSNPTSPNKTDDRQQNTQ